MTRPDPFTHRHDIGDMVYYDTGSECRACGRRWFVWEPKEGTKLMGTEPKYPKGQRFAPE